MDLLFKALCLFLPSSSYVSANSNNPTLFNYDGFPEWRIPSAFPIAVASNISDPCLAHTLDYLTALRNHLPWALQMYESSGSLAQDLIYSGSGNIHHKSGLFDECLAIQSPAIPFQGQYCTVFFDLKPTNNSKEAEPDDNFSNFRMPSVSFCLPSSCSAKDLRSAVSQLVGYRTINGINHTIVTITSENYCNTERKINTNGIQSDSAAIIGLLVLCLFALLVGTASLHEVWRESYMEQPIDSKRDRLGIRVFNCFSAVTNCRKTFSTRDVVADIQCLHGIRVLTTCWIIMLHIIVELPDRYSYRSKHMAQEAFRWEFQGITNGPIAVDTFFLISGILVAYSQMRQLVRNRGVFKIKRFYLHRYFRITPLYAAVLGFLATLYPHFGTGPDWSFVQRMSRAVRQYWWTHLLYINNQVPAIEQCVNNPLDSMTEGWYLACDMQMFCLSPLFIYPLWRWKKIGLVWTIFGLLAFLAASIAVFVVKDLPATTLYTRPSDKARLNDYCFYHYYQTYARIPPYLIGILLGWILHSTRDRKIFINKYVVAAGWVMAIVIAIAILYGMTPYLNEADVPIIHPFIRVTYGALHRSAWALTIGWIIFACARGYGGYAHRLLASKFFIPLSRLSYAAYLVNFSYIKAYSSHMRKPLYFTLPSFITTYLGVLAVVFILSAVVSVTVEMSFFHLDKILFSSDAQEKLPTGRGAAVIEKEPLDVHLRQENQQ